MVHADVGTKSVITLRAFGTYTTRAKKNGDTGRTIRESREHPQVTAEKHVLLQEQQERQQAQLAFGREIEKQNDGIRSLMVVAGTCLDWYVPVILW
jgi:hypothetical protein